jgi:hypothetical protein
MLSSSSWKICIRLVLFLLFDGDEDGMLNRVEVSGMLAALRDLQECRAEDASQQSKDTSMDIASNWDSKKPFDPWVFAPSCLQEDDSLVTQILSSAGTDGTISKDQFVAWAKTAPEIKNLLEATEYLLVFVFGVRPSSPFEERSVINQRLAIEKKHDRTRDVKYLIASTWWAEWQRYTATITQPLDKQKQTTLGPINNNSLLQTSMLDAFYKAETYSRWGEKLRKNIDPKEFIAVSDAVYSLLHFWHGGAPSLPRPYNKSLDRLELFPLNLKIMKPAPKPPAGPPPPMVPHHDARPEVVFSFNVDASRSQTLKELHSTVFNHPMQGAKGKIPESSLRLWDYSNPQSLRLLENDSQTLEQLGIANNQQILAEIRNADLTWPSELFALFASKVSEISI